MMGYVTILLLLTKEINSPKDYQNAVNTIMCINYLFRVTFKFLHTTPSAFMLVYLQGISLQVVFLFYFCFSILTIALISTKK